MKYITVTGGKPLQGELTLQGAKNSVLPILSATVLCAGPCRISRCPPLRDVEAAADILRYLGAKVHWEGEDLLVDTTNLTRCDIPEQMMRAMRSSVIFLGAVLARAGTAFLSYPGGCELGPRPIDLHLAALRALGAGIQEGNGQLSCFAVRLEASDIVLSIPSVGATENAILCACAAEGTTVITNAAREPEIEDLQNFLNRAGANIRGAGTSTVTIEGGRKLHGCEHRCIADRIVGATYLCAVAATGGDVLLRDVDGRHLMTVASALRQAGCELSCTTDCIRLESRRPLQSLPAIYTAPYPGFPTDAQAVLMAAMLRARGATMFVENIFENRYRHVPEFRRMGGDIRTEGRVAVVWGVDALQGASVHCTDLRGGAALVVAALQAPGTSRIFNTQHIRRGYADLPGDLAKLGADISVEENYLCPEEAAMPGDADGGVCPSCISS